jgi:hypothetical protein
VLESPRKKIIKIIAIPEMPNRYWFVSSFASQINRLVARYRLHEKQIFELIYMALLSPSQIQFYFVTNEMLRLLGTSRNPHLPKYRSCLCLFRYYQEIATQNDLVVNGGMNSRYQPQPLPNNSIFVHDDALTENINGIQQCVESLRSGDFLKPTGGLTKKSPATTLSMVGSVGAISFPSLCVFTGVATTTRALETAMMSTPNEDSRNSYAHKMTEFLDEHDYESPKIAKTKNGFYTRLFRAIGKSWGENISSVENACCAAFRKSPKYDVFFKGQELYNITYCEDESSLQVKVYGSNVGTELPVK